MKYRHRPVIVEAYQYTGPERVGAGGRIGLPGIVWHRDKETETWSPRVVTVAGVYVPVRTGDWVVRDAAGDGHYTVEGGSFPKLFDPVA